MVRLNDFVGIVGTGKMGPGIALRAAVSGRRAIIVGRTARGLSSAARAIDFTLRESVERGLRTIEEAGDLRDRIQLTEKMGDLEGCGLVIEAIREELMAKRELFTQLEQIVAPPGILASCTSSMRIERIAEGSLHPDRIVGMHYFFPPAKNRLVEIISSGMTAVNVIEQAEQFARECGLEPVRASDEPGFVVNRFFVPWLNENARLLGEGVANVATIDAANRQLLGSCLGPFELMNLNGVSLAAHSMEGLEAELGLFYAPCQTIKSRAESNKPWDISGEVDSGSFRVIQRRVVGILLLVAQVQLDGGIAKAEDIDWSARTGLRWRAGPFGIAVQWGESDACAAAEERRKESVPHAP